MPEEKYFRDKSVSRQIIEASLGRLRPLRIGQTWSLPKTVEESTSAHSDLASLPDGTTLCFKERKQSLTIARLSSRWMNSPAERATSKKTEASSR